MDFTAAVNAAVDQVVAQVTKHVERRFREGALARLPRQGAAKRTGSAGKRGRRHCRRCGSVKHDLRNCEQKKGAKDGKR